MKPIRENTITVRVPKERKERLQSEADKKEITLSTLINWILKMYEENNHD